MKPDQVEQVLRIQKSGDKRLFGEIALELRYIKDDAIKRYVDFLENQTPSGSAGPENVSKGPSAL